MRNRAEIHNLLRVGLGKHCKAGLTAGVNVGVVAENVQRMGSHATSRNVDDAGQQFACDLVHIRDHQQKSLRSGIGGGQSARSQRAVDSARSACFGLHFHDLDFLTEDVSCRLAENVLVGCRPGISDFRHRRRRGDRVDGCNLGERIGNVRRSGITIHG